MLPMLLLLLPAACTRHDHQRIGDLEVAAPWSRAMPAGATVAVGYLSIGNTGDVDDRLVAVESRDADHVEIHESGMVGGMMRMRQLPDGLAIPAGQTAIFAPGGNHLMFIDPKRHLEQGDTLRAVLVFRRAGRLRVAFQVRSMTAQGAPVPGHH